MRENGVNKFAFLIKLSRFLEAFKSSQEASNKQIKSTASYCDSFQYLRLHADTEKNVQNLIFSILQF